MAITQQKISMGITKETQRQLIELCELLGDNRSQVIKKAIDLLYTREKGRSNNGSDTIQRGELCEQVKRRGS